MKKVESPTKPTKDSLAFQHPPEVMARMAEFDRQLVPALIDNLNRNIEADQKVKTKTE